MALICQLILKNIDVSYRTQTTGCRINRFKWAWNKFCLLTAVLLISQPLDSSHCKLACFCHLLTCIVAILFQNRQTTGFSNGADGFSGLMPQDGRQGTVFQHSNQLRKSGGVLHLSQTVSKFVV
ncbi:unnamed protein product [Clavelina lepadiformis]|uniref:Uncharacterized protein n=1 Tax=Clavelina lepadiformis TaxID=159417 RepID=A0ABP0FXT3_CLALP